MVKGWIPTHKPRSLAICGPTSQVLDPCWHRSKRDGVVQGKRGLFPARSTALCQVTPVVWPGPTPFLIGEAGCGATTAQVPDTALGFLRGNCFRRFPSSAPQLDSCGIVFVRSLF